MSLPRQLIAAATALALAGLSWSCSSPTPTGAGTADAEVGLEVTPADTASDSPSDADVLDADGSVGPDIDVALPDQVTGDAGTALTDVDAAGVPDNTISDGDVAEPIQETSSVRDTLEEEILEASRDVQRDTAELADVDVAALDADTELDATPPLPVIWSVALPDYVLVAPVRLGPHLIGMSEYAGLDPSRQWEFRTLWRVTNGQITWETPFFPSDYQNIIAINEDEIRVVGVTLIDGVWVGTITQVDAATGEQGFHVFLWSGLLSNVAAGTDGTLYYSNGGALFAREPKAGDVVWGTVHLTDEEPVTGATIAAVPDGVVVQTAWGWVTKLDLDGEILWQKHVDTTTPDCGPLVDHAGNILSIGATGGNAVLSATGELLAEDGLSHPSGCAVVASAGAAYAPAGGILWAFGHEAPEWYASGFGFSHKTPIIATTSGLLTLTGNGPFAAVRLFDYCGHQVGAWPFPHPIEATPRFMYLTDEGLLVAFDKYVGLLESPQAFELADSPWPVQRGDVWNRHLWPGPHATRPAPPSCPEGEDARP